MHACVRALIPDWLIRTTGELGSFNYGTRNWAIESCAHNNLKLYGINLLFC